jgi:trimeric autotransporter adhesin
VGSTAIGQGAVAAQPNQMVFGTAANTYVAPGITSSASLASQTGPTNFVSSDANGHLAVSQYGPQSIANLNTSVGQLQQNFLGLNTSVGQLQQNVAGLNTSVGQMEQKFAGLNANVGQLQQGVGRLQAALNADVAQLQQGIGRAYDGTAIAIALGGATLPWDKNFAVSANWGSYEGHNAAGFTALVRLNPNLVLNAGVGAGFQGNSIGARAGLTYAW